MRLGRREHKHDDAQIDLTSMLDIVFIMLIFFIVTSSFVRTTGIEVDSPQASNAVSQKNVGIFAAITSTNDIYIDKRIIDVERVQATLEHMLLDKPEASLMIQADEHAYSGTVIEVMDAAKNAGIKTIALEAEKK